MKINVITTFKNAGEYLTNVKENGAEADALWTKHMITPFWSDIAVHAPFDQSFKQPSCIKEVEPLEKQLAILSKLDIADLRLKFEQITNALPSGDDDPMLVALYPLCESNKIIKERQNGIVGTSVFGNIIININPLAAEWEKWIPYVFSHEYHHNIWGHNWYAVRGGKGVEGTLLELLVTEGQADLFAMSLFPDLVPEWNKPFTTDEEKVLWERMQPAIYSTDHETHRDFVFGNKEKNLPWCMGYSFGRMIVADFLQKHPMPFLELLNIPARQIFKASRYFKAGGEITWRMNSTKN